MASVTAQLNVRVDAQERRQAEEVLDLMGGSLATLVREVVKKVARGTKDAEEVYDALADAPAVGGAIGQSASARLFEDVDSHYRLMAERLGRAAETLVPLSDDETDEALYDEALEKEAERTAWHA